MADDPILPTRVGHAEWGDNHAFGHSVARELLGRETQLGLVVLAVTGRRLNEAEVELLGDIAVAMTVADPRIWPLKLVRVVSAHTSALAAFAAGELCQAGAPIGHQAITVAAELLVQLRDELGARAEESEFVVEHLRSLLAEGKRLAGLGSAFFRAVDERVALLSERANVRGRAELPYFRLFLRVQTALEQLSSPPPNAALAFAALCLDLEFSPEQSGLLAAVLCSADFLGNAVEGSRQAPGVLRELPARFLNYRGREPRSTPRAEEKRSGAG
jgi:hypothetical protein